MNPKPWPCPTRSGFTPFPSVCRTVCSLGFAALLLPVAAEPSAGLSPAVLDGGSPDAIAGGNQAKPKFVAPVEPEAEIAARTKWWKDATFGMFTLLKWPTGAFELKGLKGRVTKASLLADPARKPLEFRQSGQNLSVSLPVAMPDALASVLRLDLE
jgi:hypothetical protein